MLFRRFSRKFFLFSGLLIIIISVYIIRIHPHFINALTKSFTQTSWIGVGDTSATANDTNLLDWTNYYSKTTSVNIGLNGAIKLDLQLTAPQ